MTERYFAKVVSVIDDFTIVINAGAVDGVKVGTNFLIVGIGEEIIDPDSDESLGALEILRGKARVIHVQEKMATLKSAEAQKRPDIKEIRTVSTAGKGGIASFFGPQETVTESVKPMEAVLKPFENVAKGDMVLASW